MKKILVLCLILMLLLPAQVFAHSKLTQSSPEKNATLQASPDVISLEFNTEIASLSTFVLENDQAQAVPVEHINVEGSKLTGVPVHPLDNGSYTIKWTIIGADGHTVDGDYSFYVMAPVEEQTDTLTPETTESPVATESPVTETSPEPSVNPEPANSEITLEEINEDTKNNILLPIVIIGIIIAGAIIVAVARKKK